MMAASNYVVETRTICVSCVRIHINTCTSKNELRLRIKNSVFAPYETLATRCFTKFVGIKFQTRII